MPESALAQWEGDFVTILVDRPGATDLPTLPTSGRIVRVGCDGFILQPADSPHHTGDLAPPKFYPWNAVNLVERHEPQE